MTNQVLARWTRGTLSISLEMMCDGSFAVRAITPSTDAGRVYSTHAEAVEAYAVACESAAGMAVLK